MPRLSPTVFRNRQIIDRAPDGLLGGVAEHLVRPSIPDLDPAFERERDEWVRRFVEEQLGEGFVSSTRSQDRITCHVGLLAQRTQPTGAGAAP